MKLVIVALVLMMMLGNYSCLAKDRNEVGKEDIVLSGDNGDHHEIRRKDYDNPGHVTITDDNDHHSIPRDKFDKHPGQAEVNV